MNGYSTNEARLGSVAFSNNLAGAVGQVLPAAAPSLMDHLARIQSIAMDLDAVVAESRAHLFGVWSDGVAEAGRPDSPPDLLARLDDVHKVLVRALGNARAISANI